MNFEVRFRRFVAQYFGFLVEWVYQLKFKLINFKNPPIIILTPGKVGSTSIYATLKKRIPNPVFHVHNLTESGIKHSEEAHLYSDRKSKPLHVIVSKFLRQKLLKYHGKVYLICITREPISREISSFFQNIDFFKNDLENRKLEINTEKAYDSLKEKFNNGFCDDLLYWFDLELKSNYNIDVFQSPFNKDEKYNILQEGNVSLLLMRMEDLNSVFPTAIKDFLKLDSPLVLENSNVGETKHYAQSYKEIRNNFRIESEVLNTIISSKYFQHFYSEDDQSILKKWIEK